MAGPNHVATVSGTVPALPKSRPRAPAGWNVGSPSPQTGILLPSQTQTSNTASLCRPRLAWTGGETSSRSELGTHPPFPGFGPSSWSLQNQARHGAASPPDVRKIQAMENVEHAGPGVPVPPSLGKPRMGGECLSVP